MENKVNAKIKKLINHIYGESFSDAHLDVLLSKLEQAAIDITEKRKSGWDEKDVKREGHLDTGFFDYKISCPSISFVIEAKRIFKEFNLPSNHNKTKFKSIFKENNEVITQIRNYCGDIGLQYGIITNGKQFIIGKLFNTDGTDWKENTCLIFHDINDIQNRFIEFYEIIEICFPICIVKG